MSKDKKSTGMYYTPTEILDPATGTGAFLKQAADGLSNPPYAFQHGVNRTAYAVGGLVAIVVIVVLRFVFRG